MGTLVLVRHGQASFLAADYDQLSAAGEQQAELLGRHWARLGERVDRVCSGPRVRQRRTAEIAMAAMRAAGRDVPEVEIVEGLDELQAEGLGAAVPLLAKRDPAVASILEDYALMAQGLPPSDRFPVRIERLFTRWIESGLQLDGVEAWPSFSERVRGALRELCRAPSGARVVGFTSAGTIGAALQHSLPGLPAETAANQMWRVRNSSVTEFLFTRDRFSLHALNGTPHLEDGALLTYR